MTDEPHDPTGEVAPQDGTGDLAPPPMPAPTPDPPTLTLPSMDAPKLEAPVLPPPPTFTPPPTRDNTGGMARPANVDGSGTGRRSVLPWILTAVAVAAALVFAVLWVGAKGDLDDTKAQLALAQSAGGNDVSDEVALALGRSFAPQADPALTDTEATCVGHAFVSRIGLAKLMEIGVAEEPDAQINADLVRTALDAATECGIEVSRIGG